MNAHARRKARRHVDTIETRLHLAEEARDAALAEMREARELLADRSTLLRERNELLSDLEDAVARETAAVEDARRVRQDIGVLESQRDIERARVVDLEHNLVEDRKLRRATVLVLAQEKVVTRQLALDLAAAKARIGELEREDRDPARLRRRLRDKTAELAEAHREIRRLRGEQADAEPLIIDPGPVSALAVLAAAGARSRGRR